MHGNSGREGQETSYNTFQLSWGDMPSDGDIEGRETFHNTSQSDRNICLVIEDDHHSGMAVVVVVIVVVVVEKVEQLPTKPPNEEGTVTYVMMVKQIIPLVKSFNINKTVLVEVVFVVVENLSV
eukprot:15366710-Ditylum_brightwellii.AAC.1